MRDPRRTTFVVTGRGRFPMDMLRYDQCWPKDSTDANLLNDPDPYASDDERYDFRRKLRTVTLISAGYRTPTPERWDSFGWKVVEVKHEVFS